MTGAILDAVRTEWLKVRTLPGTDRTVSPAPPRHRRGQHAFAGTTHVSAATPAGRTPPAQP